MTLHSLRPRSAAMIFAVAIAGLMPDSASAIINGTASGLSSYTVQIVTRAGRNCSGVVIGRTAVATAAHCAGAGAKILSGGAPAVATSVSNLAVLEDGTQIRVSGDAAILRFANPRFAAPVPVGSETGSHFVVAGFGTTDEAHPGANGALHQATLVRAGPYKLIDPHRAGRAISASACFGDSGGPVMQGSTLIGIITRASHTSPRIACGHLTHYAPIMRSGRTTANGLVSAALSLPQFHTVSGKVQRLEY